MEWILQLPVLFFSIIIHECAHGWTALRFGDDTAYMAGRLTLNPMAHVDKAGTFIIPAVCLILGLPAIGWAKPVPVNVLNLRNPRADMAKVAAAGPISNILMALAAMILLKLLSLITYPGSVTLAIATTLRYALFINLGLAFFNLIPIFPLDGGNILLGTLKGKALETYAKHVPYGIYIILALVLLGFVRYIIFWPIFFFYNIFF
ncbi:MAG: site-2 protease family protein [Elusimicrobiales bacterium]|nr:site-2 protease family protein [Elusimicrobiales bacterium]